MRTDTGSQGPGIRSARLEDQPSPAANRRGAFLTADHIFSDLVDKLYAAATEPEGWPDFLGQLARATGSELAVFLLHDLATQGGSCLWQFGLPEEAVGDYVEWAPENVIMKAAVPFMRTGALFPNSPAPRSEILRSAFYNEFLKPYATVVDAVRLCVFHEPPLSTMLSCSRAASKRDYGPKEHALIRALGPHLERAVSIHRRLGRAKIESASSSSALDRLACGVIFLDERGKAMLFNRAARE